MGRLDQRVVMITGGGAGIGRDSALAFAREGASVAVVDVRGDRAAQTAQQVRDAGGQAQPFVCDVRNAEEVQTAVDQALAAFGRIDILFNDAGTTRPGSVLSVSLTDWEMVLDVNLRGTFLVSRAVLPQMLARGNGVIINMGSVDGLAADPNMAAYNAAKAGVINLSRSMAIDFGAQGVRTNCICPGPIGTPVILRMFTDERRAAMDAATPLGRIGKPQDIAAIAVFLASDDAAFINGTTIVADGGLTASTGTPF